MATTQASKAPGGPVQEGAKRALYLVALGLLTGVATGWLAISKTEPADAVGVVEGGFWVLLGVLSVGYFTQGILLIKHEASVCTGKSALPFFVTNAVVTGVLGLMLFVVSFVQIQSVFGGADGAEWFPMVWTVIEPTYMLILGGLLLSDAIALTFIAGSKTKAR